MDSSNILGFIELFVVFGFVLGWGILELLGLRLDKKREVERQRAATAAAAAADSEPHRPVSAEGTRHPKRQ